MDTKILEDLGFTNAEIKVYLALLEIGSTSAGEIIQKSNLQSSVVHMTLNNLISKGFVSFVKEGQRNYYQAANPRHLIEYIEEKKKQFEKILPELLKKQEMAKAKSETITFRGIKGIKELLYELLDGNSKEYNVFGSPHESLMMGEDFWINYHQKRIEKLIQAKFLFNKSLKEWCKNNKYAKTEYKFTDEGFEPLTETIIREDMVAIIVWTESPVGILIKNKIAAKSYISFFKILWNKAE
jgi:sugar-specific transcriptional regulator TrmB